MNFFEKLITYGRTSGPGWIQAAVTLGGGSLVGALYLGVIGGYEFMWLQPLAMLCGIVMLSAISYVTLSKEREEDRPFELVKKHITPSLAWGWLIATVIANVVFCSAQFALGADAIEGNLGLKNINPYVITGLLFVIAMTLIYWFSGEGKMSRLIDSLIKILVAVIVLSFICVVVILIRNNAVDLTVMWRGFIPDFSALFHPTASYDAVLNETGEYRSFWEKYISDQQRNIIIGAFGTAVGINMTFLLPYSLKKKGWGKKDRERSRFDLALGLFIPFILVVSSLIIATASQFHAQADTVVSEKAYSDVMNKRMAFATFGLSDAQKMTFIPEISAADKQLATMLAKRNATELAQSLEPFLGKWSQLIFGIGVLAMALSTMLVHMMMNGYAISEAMGKPGQRKLFLIGASIPAIMGLLSPIVWADTVKSALIVPTSVIATTLLPIAYLIFILLMNSKKALGADLPKNRNWINIAMLVATVIAFFASFWALSGKAQSDNIYEFIFGWAGILGLPILALVGIIQFFKKENKVAD